MNLPNRTRSGRRPCWLLVALLTAALMVWTCVHVGTDMTCKKIAKRQNMKRVNFILLPSQSVVTTWIKCLWLSLDGDCVRFLSYFPSFVSGCMLGKITLVEMYIVKQHVAKLRQFEYLLGISLQKLRYNTINQSLFKHSLCHKVFQQYLNLNLNFLNRWMLLKLFHFCAWCYIIFPRAPGI